MPAKKISMRKIREVLRLKHEARLTTRQIAACASLGRTTVVDYLVNIGVELTHFIGEN
jgi:hypothetical protein